MNFDENIINTATGHAKIKDLITRKPACIGPDTTLMKAALGMKVLGVGLLPVCEQDRLVGTVTDWDITISGVAEGLDPRTTEVRAVMSAEAIWCFEDQSAGEAAEIMARYAIHHLPVLNRENQLVGVISAGDLPVRPVTGEPAVPVPVSADGAACTVTS